MKDWLRPITHTGKLFANNRSKGQGTCEWFLGHPPTAKWLRTGGVFWFYGEMGTGKTFIMSHLIQNRLDNSNIVAYYYFEVTNHSTLSEDALFRSLIFQLSALNPSCIQRLIKTHENGSLTPQLPVLQGVLLELIQSAESPFYIVIDALDELLLPSERDSLWNFLLQLCDLRPAHMSLIFSTRNQEDIKATFEEVVQYAAHIVDTNVREDIAIFTKQVFSMARWTEWPETDIKMAQEVLNKNAAGQFLMAACQLEVLSTADTTRELKKLLIAMPRKLAETYQFILDRIILSPKRHRAKMLLAILVSAFESIPLEEMVSLLAVDTRTKGSIPTYDERNKAHNPQTIIALGNAFVVVTVKEQPSDRTPRPALQLAHASMRDFLLSQRSRKHWFYMDRDLAHSTTAKACLAVLVRNMTAAPLADQYARKWWFRHIFSPCESTLLDQQIALFNEFPLWPAEVIEGFLTTLENAVWPPRRPAIIRSAISAVSAANLYDLLEYMLSSSQKPDTLNHALCIAIEAGAMSKVIKLLISQGANVNVNAESRWSLRRLTQTSAKKESKDWDNYTETPLELAASKHDLALVKVLIKQGADINRSQALRGAAFVGAVDVVNLLVDKGAKVDKDGEDQGTALQTAASQGDLVMVRLLIGKGARVNGQGGYFGAALHAAAYAGAVDILEFLLEKGANVNLVAGHYGTALQAGVCAGRAAEQVVKLLVSNGADVNKEGGHYATALQAAVTLDKTDIITLLVEHGALLLGHSEPKS
ncbi:ankyrin repeat-containing domain protein [Flagelloscypha sp. PMI_526]|nr:ankyrin repeat-containing domain protein [Flagelloscypha sp. PMI_526]